MMNEIALSDNLAQIELEINHHKQIAGQSIWEIGRRLNHVKENDLAHGQFMGWVEKIGINHSEANRMMKVANELPNSDTWQNLSSRALYLIATLPDEQKQEQLERIEQGDNPTVRELQETKREVNSLKAQLERKTAQNERLAEQATSVAKPQIIEKTVEVPPDDYQATKNRVLELEKQKRSIEWELDSANLELSTIKLQSGQAIEISEQVKHLEGRRDKLATVLGAVTDLSDITNEVEEFFDNKMAALRFKPLVNEVNAYYSIDKVRSMVDTVSAWCDEMNQIIPVENRKIVEGEIING